MFESNYKVSIDGFALKSRLLKIIDKNISTENKSISDYHGKIDGNSFYFRLSKKYFITPILCGNINTIKDNVYEITTYIDFKFNYFRIAFILFAIIYVKLLFPSNDESNYLIIFGSTIIAIIITIEIFTFRKKAMRLKIEFENLIKDTLTIDSLT